MNSLDAFAHGKLDQLSADNLRRRLMPTRRIDGVRVERNGRVYVSFSCNDYLNLSQHPAVKAAAQAAVEAYGAGAGASRLVTGDHHLLNELETKLARFKGTQAACVFGSGYLANTGITPALVGPGDLILIDALAHACLWAGAKLSGAEVATFRHNDVGHLAELLSARRGSARHALVLTDGVFSMDGDIAPLDRLAALCDEHDAWLLCDDAHGLGVVGGGRGSAALFPGARVPLQMGTLSKAVGGYGGYLCASQAVIDLIKTRARTLIFTTGLPPACAAAAIAALDIIRADPALCAKPLAKARLFTRLMRMPEAQSSIVPVIVGEADTALAAAERLEAQGLLAVAIRPPSVPAGTARLRLAFTAAHADEDIVRLAHALRPALGVAA
ncbi:MAG TPA: 8-amino-7-oxononanoate synthase [Caulobacteraceae bacterium]|jgi:8-amino-7-oxononanoate synthase